MRYVQISQTILSKMSIYNKSYIKLVFDIIKINNENDYVKYYKTKPIGVDWGTGLFLIDDNGDLSLIMSDFDSSD